MQQLIEQLTERKGKYFAHCTAALLQWPLRIGKLILTKERLYITSENPAQ
jgi:hypothetical protein